VSERRGWKNRYFGRWPVGASERPLVAAEPDHGVAESGDFALPYAAVVTAMVFGDLLMLDPALPMPPVQHHPDAADAGQLAPEVLIEDGLTLAHDEQQPNAGERP
jgi:hypothetical protein